MRKTKQELLDMIAANLPDNNEKLITPAMLREVLAAIVGRFPDITSGMEVPDNGEEGDIFVKTS
jgi:hypothetical protein